MVQTHLMLLIKLLNMVILLEMIIKKILLLRQFIAVITIKESAW